MEQSYLFVIFKSAKKGAGNHARRNVWLHASERLNGQSGDAALDRENLEILCRREFELCAFIGPNGSLHTP